MSLGGPLALWLVSLVAVAVGCCGRAAAAPAEPPNPSSPATGAPFERKYEGPGLLVPEEQRVVAQANKAGITNIESITFYNIHPSADWGVTVKEADTIEGRTARFRWVSIAVDRAATDHPTTSSSAPELGFRLKRVSAEERTLLRVGERYYRVKASPAGLDVRRAERMLAALVAGTWSIKAPMTPELKAGSSCLATTAS